MQLLTQLAKEADSSWIRRKRKVSTLSIILDTASAKVNRLGLQQLQAFNQTGCSASAIVQAKQKIPLNTLQHPLHRISAKLPTKKNKRIFAIDSTKMQLPNRFQKFGIQPRKKGK